VAYFFGPPCRLFVQVDLYGRTIRNNEATQDPYIVYTTGAINIAGKTASMQVLAKSYSVYI